MSERYPTYGVGGVTLSEVWQPEPEAYLSMCPSKMPNYFVYLGPNGGPGTGSTLVFIEAITEYICKAVKKLQREGLKSMVPKDHAIKQFGQYVDEYMKGIVYSQNCSAWFKRNTPDGRVVYLWPGGVCQRYKYLKTHDGRILITHTAKIRVSTCGVGSGMV
jgi:hypothetical protein